ncbi:MAG TPA: M28 family peptidase, partial [Symbiobacteriaceae bacterium]|nr:M28 family peptidase [Symbiobacteriaceae bacterium]
ALLPLLGELLGFWPDLGQILPRAPSQNIVGYLPSQGPLRQRFVLVAHIDTQRAGLLFHPRFVRRLPLYFNLAYALLGLAVGALLLRVEWLSLLLAALLALNGLFLWWCGLSAGETVGANDNGSGVALVLSLGEHLAANRPAGIEVVLLFTGAEEVGCRGMRRFLAERRFGPETIFINLDNLGAGDLYALQGEGMLRYHPYDPELLAVANEVAAPGELRARQNLLLPTDACPVCQAGGRVLTFIGFRPDGSIPNYHWPTDRLDGIDQLQLTRTERFLRRYLAALMDSARLGQPTQGW